MMKPRKIHPILLLVLSLSVAFFLSQNPASAASYGQDGSPVIVDGTVTAGTVANTDADDGTPYSIQEANTLGRRTNATVTYREGTSAGRYRNFTGVRGTTANAWGTETTVDAFSAVQNWQKQDFSPVNHSLILVVQTSATNPSIELQRVFSSDTPVVVSTSTDAPVTTRKYDIAYERISAEAIIAFQDDVDPTRIGYVIRHNDQIGPDMYASDVGSGNITWIQMVPHPWKDDIMMISLDSNSDIYAQTWNGSGWSPSTLIENNAASPTNKIFDFKWESLSGEGVVVYGEGTTQTPRYRNYTSGGWSGEGSQATVSGTIGWVDAESDPISDRIMTCVFDSSGSDLNCRPWSGSAWLSGLEVSTGLERASAFTVNWESTDSEAIVIFGILNTDAPSSRVWTAASGWAGSASAMADRGGDPQQFKSASNPNYDEIVVIYSDDTNDLTHNMWNGTNWDTTASATNYDLTANLGITTVEPYGLQYSAASSRIGIEHFSDSISENVGDIQQLNVTYKFRSSVVDLFQFQIFNHTSGNWESQGCTPLRNMSSFAANTYYYYTCNKTSENSNMQDYIADGKSRVRLVSIANASNTVGTVDIDFIRFDVELPPAESYVRQVNETLSNVNFVDRSKEVSVSVADLISIPDFVQRAAEFGKSLSEMLILPDLAAAIGNFGRSLSVGLSFGDIAAKLLGFQRNVGDSLGIAQSTDFAREFLRTLSDSLSLREAANALYIFQRTASETIITASQITQNLVQQIFETLTESLNFSEAAAAMFGFQKTLSESLSLTDAATILQNIARSISESLNLIDAASGVPNFERLVYDTLGISDLVANLSGVSRSLTENLRANDLISNALNFQEFLSETLGASELSGSIQNIYRLVAEYLDATDFAQGIAGFQRAVADALSITDATEIFTGFLRAVGDGIRLTDIGATALDIQRTFSESVSLTDFVSAVSGFQRAVFDVFNLSEMASVLSGVSVLMSETFGLTESSQSPAGFQRIVSDAFDLGDISAALQSLARNFSESFDFADASVALYRFQLRLAESLSLNDIVDSAIGFQRAVVNSVSASAVFDALVSLSASVSESIALDDLARAFAGFQRSVVDSANLTDVTSVLNGVARIFSEFIGLSDVGTAAAGFQRIVSDTLSLDVLSKSVLDIQRTLAESLSASDFARSARSVVRSVNDNIGSTEVIKIVQGAIRAVSDRLNFSDISAATQNLTRTITEAIGTNDAASVSRALQRAVAEALSFVDDVARSVGQQVGRSVSEIVGLNGIANALRSVERSVTETFQIPDFALLSLTLTRSFDNVVVFVQQVASGRILSVSVSEILQLIDDIIRAFTEFIESVVEEITSPVTGGGGGGGGGSSSASETVGAIAGAGTTGIEFNRETSHGIAKIEVDLQSAASGLQLSVQKLSNRPVSVAQASGAVYTYLEISATGTDQSNVRGAKITFVVTSAWLSQNGIDAGTVALNRHSDGQWNRLPTSLVSSGANSYTFEAETPGFSTFAITGDRVVGITGTVGALAGDIGITNLPVIIGAAAGGTAITEIEVKNMNSGSVADVGLKLSGLPDSWYAIAPSVQVVPTGETRKFIVAFSVPADAEASDYKVNAYVESQSETDSFSFFLRVSPATDELKRPVITRTVNFETEKGKTDVVINVINPEKQFGKISVRENVDKSLANNTDYIEFSIGTPEIIEKDPVFLYEFDSIRGGEVRNAMYRLPDISPDISTLVYWPFEQATFFDETFPDSFRSTEPSNALMLRNFDNGFEVVVENTDGENHTLEVSLELPHGWTSNPASVTHEMGPHESKKFNFDVKVPVEEEGGNRIMTVVYRWDDAIVARDIVVFIFRQTAVVLFFVAIAVGSVVAYLVLRRGNQYGAPRYGRLQAVRDSIMGGGAVTGDWKRPHTAAYGKLAAVKESLERSRRSRHGR